MRIPIRFLTVALILSRKRGGYMSTNAVQNNGGTESAYQPLNRNTGNLGKDDFLNLLVTQMRYQDPLNPMDDKEFIAQMAQFTSMEQMQNMNLTMTNTMAFGMVGKEVRAVIQDEESGELQEVIGIVDSVRLDKGKAYAVIDGRDVPVDDITDVFETFPAEPRQKITDFTNLIGKNVTAVFIDGKREQSMEIVGDVSELSLTNGVVYSHMDNVNGVIDDVVLSEEEEGSFVDLETYLDGHMDQEITAVLKTTVEQDGETVTRKVTVKGILRSVTQDPGSGELSVRLDDIRVPANNVVNIK